MTMDKITNNKITLESKKLRNSRKTFIRLHRTKIRTTISMKESKFDEHVILIIIIEADFMRKFILLYLWWDI